MRTLPPLHDADRLEHRVAEILTKQEIHGWTFDEQKSQQLESHLRREMEELTQVLRRQFPLIGGALFTPKRDNSTQGYKAGAEFQRLKEFNPTSRDHIAWILTTHFKVKSVSYTHLTLPTICSV